MVETMAPGGFSDKLSVSGSCLLKEWSMEHVVTVCYYFEIVCWLLVN